MRLDVIIPTYNRCELLPRTLASLLAAECPEGLEFEVTVVDNNSQDATRQVVEEWRGRFGQRLHYVFELRQGRSHALNAGIVATENELVGFIDDDEEVEEGWLACVHRVFAEPSVDFIGGPCMPRWGAEPPEWLPEDYPAVVGRVDGGTCVAPYGPDFPGILMGGNAVLRRALLERAGPYMTDVGRTGERMLSGEDEEMYRRLLAVGGRGFYRPDLIIYHHVPPERLTKRYHRRWCFWRGVSCGVIDRAGRQPVAYLGGVPRYLYGRAARGLARALAGQLGGAPPARVFSHELSVWDFAGFFYGKHLYRVGRQDGARSTAA